jgi:hypothetical protein
MLRTVIFDCWVSGFLAGHPGRDSGAGRPAFWRGRLLAASTGHAK